MGQSRDAARLHRLVAAPVTAAVLVDRPNRLARAKSNRFADGVELRQPGPPAFVLDYEATLDAERADPSMALAKTAGLYLGLVGREVVLARRGLSGRAKELLRSDPIGQTRIGWLDDELASMRTRYLHCEFPDGRWALFATTWRHLVPDDADVIIRAMGANAHRLTSLARHRDRG
jgi:hypothetical protein